MKSFLAAAIFVWSAGNACASANNHTWQDLREVCANTPHQCDMYLMGVLDALVLANAGKLDPYCLPDEGISDETGVAVFNKLLSDHPEAATKNAAAMVYIALARAFPCPAQ